jgi:hypothetical protein
MNVAQLDTYCCRCVHAALRRHPHGCRLLPMTPIDSSSLAYDAWTLPPGHSNRRRVPRPDMLTLCVIFPAHVPYSNTFAQCTAWTLHHCTVRTAPACQRSSPWPDIFAVAVSSSHSRLPSSPRFYVDMLAQAGARQVPSPAPAHSECLPSRARCAREDAAALP